MDKKSAAIPVIYLRDDITPQDLSRISKMPSCDIRLQSGDFTSLSSLAAIRKQIRALHLIGAGSYDVNGIPLLDKLEYLTLETAAKLLPSGQLLDFSKFPNLRECHVYWREEYSPNLFQCEKLRDLRLFSYDRSSFTDLGRAKHLVSLSISQSKIESLNGVKSMKNLERLDLGSLPRLTDIDEIRSLPRLKFLRLQNVGGLALEALLPIFDAVSVEEFMLGKTHDLPNLLPFEKLKSLKTFVTPCQVLDQDFSILFRLKKLKQARFLGLKNFTASDEELQDIAKRFGRKLSLEIIGRGRKEQTVIFNLT